MDTTIDILFNKTLINAVKYVEGYVGKREGRTRHPFNGLRRYMSRQDTTCEDTFRLLISAFKNWLKYQYYYFDNDMGGQDCIETEYASFILQQFDKEVAKESNDDFKIYIRNLYKECK